MTSRQQSFFGLCVFVGLPAYFSQQRVLAAAVITIQVSYYNSSPIAEQLFSTMHCLSQQIATSLLCQGGVGQASSWEKVKWNMVGLEGKQMATSTWVGEYGAWQHCLGMKGTEEGTKIVYNDH